MDTFKLSNKGNLKVVKDFTNDVGNKKYIIDKVSKRIIAEDDYWGGYDTGERIMTIYYKVRKKP